MKYRGGAVAANVSIMFTEFPYLARFAAARAAGFDYVESWWPFPSPTPTEREQDEILEAVDESGVRLRALNVWAGDMPSGERGVATMSSRAHEIEDSLPSLRRIAAATGCELFNLLVGRVDPSTLESQVAAAVEIVRSAAIELHDVGSLLIEPISGLPHGAFPIISDEDAIGFCRKVDVANIAVLFDVYHLGTNGIDLIAAAKRTAGLVGHVQLADSPGRGAPGTGALPIAAVVDAVRAEGYRGLLGAEYLPGPDTEASLGWMDDRGL